MKKLLFLIPVFTLLFGNLLAQDDDLPPPTSKPKTETQQPTNSPDNPNAGTSFKGFGKAKKLDLSKFIIEPDFDFNISQQRLDFGISPYVGYRVWSPKTVKDPSNGLYLGGGITYFYTGFSGLEVTNLQGVPIGTVKANFHTYGGGVFGQYNIWKGIFARVKVEVLHRSMDDLNQNPLQNPSNGKFYFPKIEKTIPACLVGAGYNLLRSKNFFFPIMVSYDVLHSAVNQTYSLYPHGWVVQLGFVTVF